MNRVAVSSKASLACAIYDIFFFDSHIRSNAYLYSYLIGSSLSAPFVWAETVCCNRHSTLLSLPSYLLLVSLHLDLLSRMLPLLVSLEGKSLDRIGIIELKLKADSSRHAANLVEIASVHY